jgi:hypothetical protein
MATSPLRSRLAMMLVLRLASICVTELLGLCDMRINNLLWPGTRVKASRVLFKFSWSRGSRSGGGGVAAAKLPW